MSVGIVARDGYGAGNAGCEVRRATVRIAANNRIAITDETATPRFVAGLLNADLRS